MRRLAVTALATAALALTVPARASGGLDPTHISLPSGPGSIEGLGRSFAPSLASGTASYGVDIAVPPSAGGFEPHLSLDYDSSGGVTDVGMGWRLSGIPTLRRRTENGLPRFTATDPMEIAGIGVPCDLLEVTPGTFRPEYESGAFVRVQQSGTDTWQARDKSGVTWNFGGAGFEEAEGPHIATYLPSEAIDLHGHKIAYTWDASSGYALLTHVVWNDFGSSSRNEILATYEDRPDAHVLYGTGIRQAITKRMTALEVRHGGQLVRRYELAYGTDIHSRLATVSLVGRDGSSRLPTLSLSYTTQTLQPQIVAMQNPPGRTPGDPNIEISDLDGDGLPDLLVTLAGQYSSFLNQDGTTWQSEVDWDASQSPSMALGDIGVQLADLDGDGAIDLVAKSGTSDFRYFPGNTATTFRAPVQIATVPNFTFEDPDTKLADMNGDRLIDVVVTTAAGIAIGYNLGGVDWTLPQIIGPVDPHQDLRFSDGGHTQLCDVNGDRVQDFCYLTPGSLVFWPGRGRGAFDPPQIATGVPTFDPSSPWELHDLNGDGWVDLVHVDPDQVEVALAHAAGQFDAQQVLTAVPTKNPTTTIRYADMNGSGTTDIVWIDVTGASTQAWQYVELFPAGRAGLLQRLDNGLGKITTMTYRAAAVDAAAARTAGTPWTSRMNVPMSVVRSVKVDDSLGDPIMETDYDYANGTWSPVERTFAGFAGGTDRAQGDAYTPTLVTTSTFDVGLDDRTLRGVVLTTQEGDESGTIFSSTQTTWTTRALQTVTDGRTVNYSFKTSEQTKHIEGSEPSQARITLVEWDQDSWGNPISEHNWGEVVGGNKLAGNDEAITIRTFATDAKDWILGRLASEELQDATGKRVRRKETFYDGAPFQGLALGQVARGDVSREQEWVGPDPSAYDLVVATAYDKDGNPTETKDARGGGHLLGWDPTDHTTLLSEGVKLDTETLTESVTTDPAFGTILSVTGYDGQVSSFQYDPFGRVTTIAKPGDSDEKPTVSFAYDEAAPLSNIVKRLRTWAGRDDVEVNTSYFDGLDRKRAVVHPNGSGQTIVSGVGLLDARGELRRDLRPWLATAAQTAPRLSGTGPGSDAWHDAMGRVIRTRSQLGIQTRIAHLPLTTQAWDGAQADSSSPYEHTPRTELYDGLGRVVATRDILGGQALEAHFAYDAAGELVSRVDPEGNASSYAYDGRGRRVDLRDPDSGHHTFTYDAADNLLTHQHPDGAVNRYQYDLAGRTTHEDWDGDGAAEVVRTYDHAVQGTDNQSFRGRLAQVTDPSGGTRYAYDSRGRQTAIVHDIKGTTYEIDVAYDNEDRVYWRQFPDRSSIRIARDARGLIVGYGDAVSIERDTDGAELKRSFNTGVVETVGYDDDRRPTESIVSDPGGSEISHLRWTFDGANNILAVSDLRAGIGPDRDRSERYVLDNLYRLRSAHGTWGSSAWGYSPSGNMLTRASTNAALPTATGTYGQHAGPHALTSLGSRTIRYDAAGRMTDDGQREYTWNALDQLVDVRSTTGADVQSTFDGDGMRRVRVEVTPGGQTSETHFIDPWCESKDGQLIRYIVHGGRRIARLSPTNGAPGPAGGKQGCSASGGTDVGLGSAVAVLLGLALVAAHRNRRWRVPCGIAFAVATAMLIGCAGPQQGPAPILEGSIQQLSASDEILLHDAVGSLTEEVDGVGGPKGTFAPFPFGVTRYDTSGEGRKYANSPRDESVGLDQMGARAYAPDLGAWTSADPLAIESPEALVGGALVTANPYAYAGVNPVSRVDTDGHTPAGVIALTPLAADGGAAASGTAAAGAAAGGAAAGGASTAPAWVPTVILATIMMAPAIAVSVYYDYYPNHSTDPTGTVAPVPSLAPEALPPPPPLVSSAPSTAPPPSVAAAPAAASVHTTPAAAPAAQVAVQATAGPKNVKKIDAGKIKYAPNARGQAPWGVDGNRIEIHHVGQEPYGDAEEMTATEHRGPGNYKKNHPNGNAPSKIDRPEFNQWKEEYWSKEWDSGRFEGLPSKPGVVQSQSGS